MIWTNRRCTHSHSTVRISRIFLRFSFRIIQQPERRRPIGAANENECEYGHSKQVAASASSFSFLYGFTGACLEFPTYRWVSECFVVDVAHPISEIFFLLLLLLLLLFPPNATDSTDFDWFGYADRLTDIRVNRMPANTCRMHIHDEHGNRSSVAEIISTPPDYHSHTSTHAHTHGCH